MTSNIICKANGKDKVIDFRDRLSLACTAEYATMHQLGGKSAKNADSFPSIIEAVICDFTKGTGDKSVTLSVNVEPSVFFELYEVCKKSLGSSVIPIKDNVLSEVRSGSKAEYTFFKKVCVVLGKLFKGELKTETTDFYKELGTALKESKECFEKTESLFLKYPNSIEYTYSQEKVNGYKKDKDGFAPVTSLLVNHSPYMNDGEVSRYPWYIKILSFEAKVKENGNGAETYDGSTAKNKREAFINVSDRDMYRMMHRVTRYIETWENAMCIPTIIDGKKAYASERSKK